MELEKKSTLTKETLIQRNNHGGHYLICGYEIYALERRATIHIATNIRYRIRN